MSMAALKAENARLQAEIGRLGRALGDFNERIVCGRLAGDLPDNFLEQFSQLPDRPLEQVLRFLPARQVAQMRHVSRKFNHLITKCSKSMPKKKIQEEEKEEEDDEEEESRRRSSSVLFKSCNAGELTVEWLTDEGRKIAVMKLAGDEVALSELLRFIHIGGTMYFDDGVSAADKVLDQLSKSWLTVRPEMVVFSGYLSQTSRVSLRAFLKKVEPSVKKLHFENTRNMPDSLLSDNVIGAAGRLDGLLVMPACWGSEPHNFSIGDETLLAVADAKCQPLYCCLMGCSGITTGGIRAFIEKWMKKERQKADVGTFDFHTGLDLCRLVFYKCANVTPAAVEEACGDLLKKETIASAYSEDMNDRAFYFFQCNSSKRRLEIRFNTDSFRFYILDDPTDGH
uniref:F-box domain-containing protein n=2 Tax=Plectus sambesii TaxID=2011161 RepID=A0A914VDQ1_9BILA